MAGGVPRSCCLRRGGQVPGGRARHRRLPAGRAHRCARVDEDGYVIGQPGRFLFRCALPGEESVHQGCTYPYSGELILSRIVYGPGGGRHRRGGSTSYVHHG